MLTRIYIDNYRCMVNFEFRPKRKQLIIGGNGTGKSTLLEVLDKLRRFAIDGENASEVFPPATWTRWDTRVEQHFELNATLNGEEYRYKLSTARTDTMTLVGYEALLLEGEPLLQSRLGETAIFSDLHLHNYNYLSDVRRSSIGCDHPSI